MLYNERTRKFVLFFHLDSPDFGPVPGSPYSGHVGMLTSDKVREELGTILRRGAERSNIGMGWLTRHAYGRGSWHRSSAYACSINPCSNMMRPVPLPEGC